MLPDSPPEVYFDHNATTPVAPEVVEAMTRALAEDWGNPSSACAPGRRSAQRLEAARGELAALLAADPNEIVCTSGGTESIHTALHSALVSQPDRRHLVATAVEHPATLRYLAFLERQGLEVTLLPVSTGGHLDLERLEGALRPDTALISVIWANNETGVLLPVPEIAAVCRRRGVLCHTDAVQTAGKIPLDAHAAGVDYLSLSGHKLHAPKGVGLLYVRDGAPLHPYFLGGHQERGRRAGTENVAGIVAFGCAAERARRRLPEQNTRVRALRDRLEQDLMRTIPGTFRNGAAEPRLPNTCNLAFEGVEAEAVLVLLDRLGVCASAGSACTTGSPRPSHVLTAMGVPPERARGSLRFSLGLDNTERQVDYVLERLPGIVGRLRAMSPFSAQIRPVA